MNDTDAESLPASYFDDVYAASDDPWRFATSAYEAEKYRVTLDALGERTFERALEVGCSIGVFTAQLARRCRELVAVDVSEAALATARKRCAGLAQVRFERASIPQQFPAGRFDLVTTCEVAYYWSRADFARSAALIERSLEPDGFWLMVHWTPPVADYPLGGDEVHELALERSRGPDAFIRHVGGARHEHYRLDLFARNRPAR